MNTNSSTLELRKSQGLLTGICALLCLGYFWFFVQDLKSVWFNSLVTTDDSYQQVFPFYEVLYPDRFSGDLIYSLMRGYLPPLHYLIGAGLTLLTKDPILNSQIIMTLQFALAVLFIFLLVQKLSQTSVALLAIIWFMHSQPIWQRSTGGLPRGWPLVLIPATLYCLVLNKTWAIHLCLLCTCLLNPPVFPALFLCYALLLVIQNYKSLSENIRARKFAIPKTIWILLASIPLYALVVLIILKRPPEIGSMVTLEQALEMPEFSVQGGRFPFLPFPPISQEMNKQATQVFVSKLYPKVPFLKANIGIILISVFILLGALAYIRKTAYLPLVPSVFVISTFIVYLLSRPLAFHLYVPDRHLLIPFAIFLICCTLVGIYNIFYEKNRRLYNFLIPYTLLFFFIFLCSGSGFTGVANFNRIRKFKNDFHSFIFNNTAPDSIVACHPDTCDSVPLYTARRTFAFTEAAHPFYPEYFRQIEQRIVTSLELNYSRDLKEFSETLQRDKIDYFVFKRADFYPENLGTATYYRPLDSLVKELASYPVDQYVYKKYFSPSAEQRHQAVVYSDAEHVVIEVQKLKGTLTFSTLDMSEVRHLLSWKK